MLGWFLRRGVKQGITFALLIYLVCALNDVLMKFLGDRLHFIEISFFRFLFSAVTAAIPLLLVKKNFLQTDMHGMHAVRGLLGTVAVALCCLGVNVMPLAENTTILFSEALFLLPMAGFVLKEHINCKSIIATVIGFLGLVIMFRPSLDHLNLLAIIPTAASFLFAIMSIMIKIMVDKGENNITMLLYFSIYTTIISLFFVPFFWISPTIEELILLFLLGIGANLVQLFLFLAYRATQASIISPIRYAELPFTVLFGFIAFGQIPDAITIIGALFIVIGTLLASCNRANGI
ncbi:MAG: DMT family transporter [Holosporales bacterium]|jgi:S-adenosylmethionine uptake transporter|nr:DMT family transporter [Holosporales bacterium]